MHERVDFAGARLAYMLAGDSERTIADFLPQWGPAEAQPEDAMLAALQHFAERQKKG